MADTYRPKSWTPASEATGGYRPESWTPAGEKAPDTGAAEDLDYTAIPATAAPAVAMARSLQPRTAERAAAINFAQQGTMGYSDEIGGTLATLLPSPGSTAGRALTAVGLGSLTGVPESSVKLGPAAIPSASDSDAEFQAKSDLIEGMASAPTSYELVRNRMRGELKQAQADHPAASMIGGIAGGVAGSVAGNILLPGGGAVARGAAEGAIAGLGSSEADLLGGDVLGAAADTATGALVGGAAGGVGAGLGWVGGKILGGAPRVLESAAQGRAVKAATGQNKREIGKMIAAEMRGSDVGTVERVGSDLLDQGVVTAGANADDMLQRAVARRAEFAQLIDDSLDELDALSGRPLNTGAIADDLETSLVAPFLNGTRGQRQVAARMAEEIQALRDQGPVGLRALEEFKRGLDDAINYAADIKDPAQKALLRMRTILNETIETEAERIARANGSEAAANYLNAKAVTGSMSIGERVARNQAVSQASNRLIAPSDYGMGAVGAVVSGIASGGSIPAAALTGLAIAGGHKVLRQRGNQVAAAALRGLSGNALLQKVAEVAPDMLGQFAGPITAAIARGAGGDDAALSAVDYVLQQTYPEYRAMKEALVKEVQ
jgi:hypothetical protein